MAQSLHHCWTTHFICFLSPFFCWLGLGDFQINRLGQNLRIVPRSPFRQILCSCLFWVFIVYTNIENRAFTDFCKNRLVNQVDKFLNETDLQGVHKPEIISGQIGAKAQSKGAAASIISKDYLIDNNTLHRG